MKHGLLWVTYGKDYPFFEASINSYRKFARGFDYARVIVPNADVPQFTQACAGTNAEVRGIEEPPGKGMVMHMAMQILGETHFPDDTDFIFHIDGDCVFNNFTSPLEFFRDGKPVVTFRDFDELLTRPVEIDEVQTFMGYTGRTIDFSRGAYLWKFAADLALGWPVIRQCMTRMPIVHHRKVYPLTRSIIEKRFNTDVISHILSGRNSWPQSFCEFETLGGVADKFFRDDYYWHHLTAHGFPPCSVTQTWSHGGLDATYEQDRPQIIAGVHRSPRQYFESLGIL